MSNAQQRRSEPALVLPSAMGARWQGDLADSPHRPNILVIDELDANAESLRELLEKDGYRVIRAHGAAEGHEMLDRAPIDLVLLNMPAPGTDGMEFCRRLRANHRTELLPTLILSDSPTAEHEIAGIASGADGFLGRPFHPDVLCARVSSMLRHKALVDGLEESDPILVAIGKALEHRDNNTAGHCDRLAALAVAMGMAMELPSQHLLALHRGGYLHDIGKIAIPDAVLFKKGPLTEGEWEIMRTHTVMGREICRPIKCLCHVLPIVRSHHERWDGSGYPDHLSGHDIPLLARVLQLADIYDALLTTRSYKVAMTSPDALRVMQEETDRGWRDPELMRVFLRLRHDTLRDAAVRHAGQWHDVNVMRKSLENLRSSIMQY